jgi:hypothetical protein
VTVPEGKTILYLNGTAGAGAWGGYVVADPTLNSPTALAHEMSHLYGLNDSADDAGNWYGDPHDVMSAMNVLCFGGNLLFDSADAGCNTGGVAAPSGPGLDAGNRIALGLLPSGRVRQLTPGASKQTVSLDVTALDRPEAGASAEGAAQAIRIPIAAGPLPECVAGNTCSTTGNYYTVELREPRGWDRSFARAAVEIHKVALTNDSTQTFLQTGPSEYLAGSTYQDPNITVKVDSLAPARGVARVTVTY